MIERLVRKEILKVQPYIPGKPIEALKRELGIKGKIIKLASNENPLGPSPKSLAAIRKAAKDVFRYPEGSSFLLREAVAKKNGVSSEEIIFGSGSDELIEQLGKTFLNPEDEIVISEHAFVRYRAAGELMGCKVISVPMIDYRHDLRMMAESATVKTKIIFIANPNNPTGTYNDKQELTQFIKRLNEKFGSGATFQSSSPAQRGSGAGLHSPVPPLVVLDEAYYEYARSSQGYPESVDYYLGRNGAVRYTNLVILRTFSKAHALAGLRVGYAIANREVVQFLDRARPPFNVTNVSQAAALESLKDTARIKKTVAIVEEGKKYVCWELKKLGLSFVPPAANFILIDVAPFSGQTVFEMLLRKGVIIRAMNEYDLPNHVRVTIGTQKENKIFLEKFQVVLKELKRDTAAESTI